MSITDADSFLHGQTAVARTGIPWIMPVVKVSWVMEPLEPSESGDSDNFLIVLEFHDHSRVAIRNGEAALRQE